MTIFDTGSPTSFIRRSSLPNSIQCGDLYYSHLQGLGSVKLYIHGKAQCCIKIRGHLQIITVLILPADVLPTPLLLGRDCLKKFNIKLKFCGDVSNTSTLLNNCNKNNNFNFNSVIEPFLLKPCSKLVPRDVSVPASSISELNSTCREANILVNDFDCLKTVPNEVKFNCIDLPYIFSIEPIKYEYNIGPCAVRL